MMGFNKEKEPAWEYAEQLIEEVGGSRRLILVNATHTNTLRWRAVGRITWDSETAPPFLAIVEKSGDTKEFVTRFAAADWLKEQWDAIGE